MDNELKEKLEKIGLNAGEETVKATAKNAFEAIEAIVKATPTPIDDALVLPLISILKPIVDNYADKIDGEVG